MPSAIKKILKMQVGTYVSGNGRETRELREVGVLIEHTKGDNSWHEIKLHADLLQPVLYQLVKPYIQKGSASVRVEMFDLPRSRSVESPAGPPPADEEWDGDDGRFDRSA